MKLDFYLIPYTKIHSKWVRDLNVIPGTTKTEKNRGNKLLDIGLVMTLVSDSPSKGNKSKNKSVYRKIKSFCRSKDIINKMKRQSAEWENMFTNYIPVQGLIFKMCKEFIQFNIKTPKNPTKKMSRGPELTISRGDIQMVNRYMKRCSTSLIIRKVQIKTTPVGMANSKRTGNNRGQQCEGTETVVYH